MNIRHGPAMLMSLGDGRSFVIHDELRRQKNGGRLHFAVDVGRLCVCVVPKESVEGSFANVMLNFRFFASSVWGCV